MEDDSEGGDRTPAWIVSAITTAGDLRPEISTNRTRLAVARQG
jgi:hypothetical protein